MTVFEKAFEEVSKLAHKFGDNYPHYSRSEYQEAEVRKDFIDKFLENKCASLDRQIDNLVYKLYDLTEEEIKIVER